MTQLTQGSDMEQDQEDVLQGEIFTALGEASGLFMSSPLPGTKQIMPTEALAKIGTDLYDKLRADKQRSIDRAVADFASKLKVVQMVHDGSKEVFDVVLKTEIDYWLSPTTTEEKETT